MLQQQVMILNNVRMTVDALCIILAGYSAHAVLERYMPDAMGMDGLAFLGTILAVMFVNNYIMGRLGLYGDSRPPSRLRLLTRVTQAIVLDFVILAGASFMFPEIGLSRPFLLAFAAGALVLTLAGRFIEDYYMNHLVGKGCSTREILIVGSERRGKLVAELMEKQLSWGHKVMGRLLVSGDGDDRGPGVLGILEDLPRVLKEHAVDEVVFAMNGDRAVDLGRHLETCRKMGIPTRILPALWQPGDHALSAERCQGVPFLTVPTVNINATGQLYKRLLDICGALVGCLLLILMLPVIGTLIKLDSPGPVFFRQERIGRNGRVFTLFKFRTMVSNAEELKQELLDRNEMQGGMFKVTDDPRITRVGAWLRKTSLDEFPQFINVLRGEMSLVGTRPPTLEEVKGYEEWQRRRISAKPGITGLWQVSGRSKVTDFNKVVELDCSYLDNWRFVDDLRIIAQTVVVVLQRKGAM
ncbi:MAG: sugar transferase [Thermodesulfobacteriota bacterium]